MKTTVSTIILVIAMFTCNTVIAAPNSKGFYIGFGKGSAKYTHGNENNQRKFDAKKDFSAFKTQLGYRHSNIGGIEVSIIKHGEFQSRPNQGIGSTSTFTKIEAKSTSVSANLGYTFPNGIRPFTMIGASVSVVGRSSYINAEKTKTDTDTRPGIHFGLGLEFAPEALRYISFRLTYETDYFLNKVVEIDSEDIYSIRLSATSLGINAEF